MALILSHRSEGELCSLQNILLLSASLPANPWDTIQSPRVGDCAVALYVNSTVYVHVMLIKPVEQSDAMMVLKLSFLTTILGLKGHMLVSCQCV